MNSLNQKSALISLMVALAVVLPVATWIQGSARQDAIQPPFPASQVPGAAAQSLSTARTLPGPEQNGAARLLCDFFGLNPAAPDRERGDYCLLMEGRNPKGYHIEHIIATIPDPRDSRLDYFFDRNLDAMQRAVETTGYVLDRNRLPWGRSTSSQQPGGETPYQLRRNYLREPGIILFRNIKPDDRRLLLLFLVGETPTTGIHKDAFNNALDQIMRLHEAGIAQPSEDGSWKIRVLGPSFSGSATSLALSIKELFNQREGQRERSSRVKVQIISGSATAVNKNDILCLTGNNPNVTFNTTVPLDTDVQKAFIKYLKNIGAVAAGVGEPNIAILTEANTSYGQESKPQKEIENTARSKRIKEQMKSELNEESPCLAERTPVKERPDVNIISLTFPLHISKLRGEVSKTRTAKPDAGDSALSPSHETSLPLDEGNNARDVIPLFSPLETASTELVLREILSAIHREPIRYIGLVATDVQDQIFLVRELRKHCPNTVIFMFTGDLLYLHSEANLDFRGALVVTPYPLFNLNQYWSYPFNGDKGRLQFSSHGTQGIYNAMLALMNEPEGMVEYGRPFDTGRSSGPGSEYHFHEPVYWLSIIGRNGIWPVKILGPDEKRIIPQDILKDGRDKFQQESARNTGTYPVLPKLEINSGENNQDRPVSVRHSDHSTLTTGVLLFIGLLCLFPVAVLLLQMVREMLNEQSHKWPFKLIRQRFYFLKLTGSIHQWLNSLRLLNRTWIGRTFSVDEKYCYNFDRRVYLFSCCASLLIISLVCTVTALLPEWIRLEKDTHWDHSFWARAAAYTVFALTLILLFSVLPWLLLSIIDWVRQPYVGLRSRSLAFFSLLIDLVMLVLAGIALGKIVTSARDRETALESLFFFLRATDFRSGVSILLPWIFMSLAFFFAIFSALRRLELAEKMYFLKDQTKEPPSFDPYLNFTGESFAGLKTLEDKVKGLVIGRIFSVNGAYLMIIIVGVPYYHRFIDHHIPSIEGRWIDWFFKMGFFLIPLLLGWAFLRFCWLSLALARLLKRLEWHPLFNTPIDPSSLQLMPKVNLMSPTPTYTAMSASITHAKEFFRLLDDSKKTERVSVYPNRIQKNIWFGIDQAEEKLQQAIRAESEGRWRDSLKPRRETQQAISAAANEIADWMEQRWTDIGDDSAKYPEQIKQGRIFMIGHVASFLQYILVHLQNLAGLVTIGLLLMLLAATSYPFQPREPLLLFSWVSMLVVAAVTLFIFVQLNRDRVLSLLSGTRPGSFNLSGDLVYRVMIHGIVPIIALLGAQFPEAVQNILSWVNIFQSKGS
jgi:hypothetical protein